jgi:hypothetical protein
MFSVLGLNKNMAQNTNPPVIQTLQSSNYLVPYNGWVSTGMTRDDAGNLYISEGCSIRKISYTTLTENNLSTPFLGNPSLPGYAGDGQTNLGATILFNNPQQFHINGLAYYNNILYIVDNGNQCVRAYDLNAKVITLFAGTPGVSGTTGQNGPALSTALNNPSSIVVDKNNGDLYITEDDRISKISNGMITTVSNEYSRSLAISSNGSLFTVHKAKNNGRIIISQIDLLNSNNENDLAGSGIMMDLNYTGDAGPQGFGYGYIGNKYYTNDVLSIAWDENNQYLYLYAIDYNNYVAIKMIDLNPLDNGGSPQISTILYNTFTALYNSSGGGVNSR